MLSPPKTNIVPLVLSYPIEAYFIGGGTEPVKSDVSSIHCKGGTGVLVAGFCARHGEKKPARAKMANACLDSS